MGFYFLFECHGLTAKFAKKALRTQKNLSKLLFKIALNYFKKNNGINKRIKKRKNDYNFSNT